VVSHNVLTTLLLLHRQQFDASHAIMEEPRESLHQEHTDGPFQKLEQMWKQMTGNLKRQ
jgi:ribosome-associated toxin RatA of RatAB toxin-antitoxin module